MLTADSPTGPFTYSCRLTPEDWTSIDGSLYFPTEDAPWLLFSHSFEDEGCQDMCAMPLLPDLSGPAGAPITMFRVSEAPWAVPVPFAKAEFGMDGDVYFSDGPCAHVMENGALAVIWSGWGNHGYAVGVALSASDEITGPWTQLAAPLFPGGGGHGMLFTANDGTRYYTLHTPNDFGLERPTFYEIIEENGILKLK